MTGFSLLPESANVMVGENIGLTSTASWSLSGKKVLTECVTYKSSDENVLTVTQDGVVTGIAKGTATITATVDGTDFSDQVEITVKEIARATKEYSYFFNRSVFRSTSNVQRTDLAKMTFDSIDENLSSQWKAAGTRYVYNTYADADGLVWNAYEYRADSGSAAYAIELKVPESGTYIPKLGFYELASGPITDVYLVANDGTLPEFEFG